MLLGPFGGFHFDIPEGKFHQQSEERRNREDALIGR